jgi:hypothetical protein
MFLQVSFSIGLPGHAAFSEHRHLAAVRVRLQPEPPVLGGLVLVGGEDVKESQGVAGPGPIADWLDAVSYLLVDNRGGLAVRV